MATSRRAGASFVTSRSAIRIVPPVIGSSPPIERSRVVLPQPEGPTRTMNSPSPMVRLTSSTATTPDPNSLRTSSRTIWPTGWNLQRATGKMQSLSHMEKETLFTTVAPGVERFRDTCNVYVLVDGSDAVLVDFGSGAVLEHLGELGVTRTTDVLVTHHHRDQVQGLARAVAAGARIWVPPHELELIAGVNRRWETRQLDNDYDLREDRFSLL